MTKNAGFTLIELMITVAIMSIMLTVGLPSFQSLIASNRVTSAANAMVSALQLARFEAIKQHKPVTIRKTNTNWQNGWIVFVDKDKSHTLTSDEKSFAVFDKLNFIEITSGYTNYVEYDATGRVNTGGSFCFSASTEYRKVVVAATGRVRVETPSSC